MQNVKCRMQNAERKIRDFLNLNNPSVSCADSSLYTKEPYGKRQTAVIKREVTV